MLTKSVWRIIAVAVALAALALAAWFLIPRQPKAPAPAAEVGRVYKVGYQEISLYRHVFAAQEKGLFAAEGLRVELVPFASANQMMSAMLSNKIDAAGLTNLEVALKVESEDPGQFKLVNFLIWTPDAYPDYILDCTPNKGLNKLSDLEGKTLGRHPGSAVAGFSKAVLQKDGVNLDRVQMIELQPNLMRDAVAAHRVDAVYAMDPVATLLVRDKLCDVLVDHPLGALAPSPIPISGTAVSANLLSKDPQAVAKLTRALDKAILYLRQTGSGPETADMIAKYTPIEPELVRDLKPSVYWTSAEIDAAGVQRLADRFKTLGISEATVDTRKMILPAAGK